MNIFIFACDPELNLHFGLLSKVMHRFGMKIRGPPRNRFPADGVARRTICSHVNDFISNCVLIIFFSESGRIFSSRNDN